jgi:transcriptional regulator with XRE-family HTH domain
METETPFMRWLRDWFNSNPDYTAARLAEEMGNTGAMVSKWLHGQSVPDARQLPRLSEITGESIWNLAHLAYNEWGWPEGVPTSDDLFKGDMIRDLVTTFQKLKESSPELAEDLLEVARTLRDRARRRKRAGGT